MNRLFIIMIAMPLLAPMIVEGIILKKRPDWLARFSLWKVGEHTFTLNSPRRGEGLEGYREGPSRLPIPHLEGERRFAEGVFIAKHGKRMLRPPPRKT